MAVPCPRAKERRLAGPKGSMPIRLKERGFIGPIGDDLPSLIPIIFALMIFFTTFTITFQVFEKGNVRFERTIKILEISNDLRGDKYINSFAEFERLCNRITVRGVDFRAGLVELRQEGQPFEQIEVYSFVNESAGIVKMENPATGDDEFMACPGDFRHMREGSEAIVKMFPVAFQDTTKCVGAGPPSEDCIVSGFAVRPMLLVVVVWY